MCKNQSGGQKKGKEKGVSYNSNIRYRIIQIVKKIDINIIKCNIGTIYITKDRYR